MQRLLRRALIVLVVVFVLIQIIPYGRDHSNPPGAVEPAWDSPKTRELATRACFDCHSNETVWPWYSHVAPASWLVQRDVDRARHELNFSEWNRPQDEADEAAGMVRKGKMPLWYYLPAHPAAKLSAAEKETLIAGLAATLGDEKEEAAADEDEADD